MVDELNSSLLSSDKTICLNALKTLRKQVSKGLKLTDYADEMTSLITNSDLEIRTLVFKVTDNYLKQIAYSVPQAGKLSAQRKGVDLLLSLYFVTLSDRIASIRKMAIYSIYLLQSIFSPSGDASLVIDQAGLALLAAHIADTGCDLNEAGEPLTTKGTLTIAEKVNYLISYFPRKTDFTTVFHRLIPALEQLHYYISNGIIDSRYGGKLIDCVVDMFSMLLSSKNVPLPPSLFPDTYPNYVVELISFTNDHIYHTISDTTIYQLERYLITPRTYIKDLVKALMIDDYESVKDRVLYLLGRAIEQGHSLDYFIPQIQAAITAGKIAEDSLPERLKQLLP